MNKEKLYVLTKLELFKYELINKKAANRNELSNSIENIDIKTNSQFMSRNKNGPKYTLLNDEQFDDKEIHHIFNYTNNKVHVRCNFDSIKKLYD